MTVHTGDVSKEQQGSHDENEAEGSLWAGRAGPPHLYCSNSQDVEWLHVSPCFFQNPVYNWNPQVQGFIFSSIFYGALITQIPAGYLSEKYSIKKMIGFAFLLSSLLSLLMPMAAEGGEAFLLACRVAQGAAQVFRYCKS